MAEPIFFDPAVIMHGHNLYLDVVPCWSEGERLECSYHQKKVYYFHCQQMEENSLFHVEVL